MHNFIYSIPTTIYFGKGQVEHLPSIIKQYGKRVLFLYGGGSIIKTGIYDTVIGLLNDNNIYFTELGGVEPNPRLTTVKKGIEICKEHEIDLILPVGGGSTIDCAKAIAAGAKYNGDPWDFTIDRSLIKEALPIVCILTIAATGSEMDPVAVISNMETNDKRGIGSLALYPKASILDPVYTYTVSKYQTASGVADIFSHIIESYFHKAPGAYLVRRAAEGFLKTCITYGMIALNEPGNYEARANLMWVSSWGLNGFLKCGLDGPWVIHPIEHQLSAYYDVTHGAGLAVITGPWLRKILNEDSLEVFTQYAVNVWSLDEALDPYVLAERAIKKTEAFFKSMELPSTLSELGIINQDNFEIMAKKAIKDGAGKSCFSLSEEDVIEILKDAF